MIKVKLREVMAKQGIDTNKEVSKLCNVSERQIGLIKKGLVIPNLDTIDKFMLGFELTKISDLLEYTPTTAA